MCTSIFIDKKIYLQNKKLINKFIDQQDEAKIDFVKNSDKIGCVEICVDKLGSFDDFVEYMFRKLGKDAIPCVGICCDAFEEVKEMNVMIPKMYEKMWIQTDRQGSCTMVCAKANDYNPIQLLDFYYIVYIDEFKKDNELYKEGIEEKISEYRGINNEKPYHNDYFCS
jgi:hypothetical protein